MSNSLAVRAVRVDIPGTRRQDLRFLVVDADNAVLASYAEEWRAENHAIAGCPCRMQWHYYHGEKHEPGFASLALALPDMETVRAQGLAVEETLAVWHRAARMVRHG